MPRHPFDRQGIHQSGGVGKVFGGPRRITLTLGNQGQQIGGSGLDRPTLGGRKHSTCFVIAAQVNEDAGTRNPCIDQPRIKLERTLVILQRAGQLTARMRNRAAGIEGRGEVGAIAHRQFGTLQRQIKLAAGNQHRHFGGQGDGRCGVKRAGLGEAALRLSTLSQRNMSRPAQGQHLQLLRPLQALGRNRFQQNLGPSLQQVDARHRHRHFGTTHAEPQRFAKRHLGRAHISVAQIGLRQQELSSQHIAIFLQRVLELDDRTGKILLPKALQSIFIVTAGRSRIGLRRRAREQVDKPKGDAADKRTESAFHGGLNLF